MLELKGYLLLKSNYSNNVFIGLNKLVEKEHYDKVAKDIRSIPMRIIDIAVDDSGYLCLAPDNSCIIDVRDKSDVYLSFKCCEFNNILCPPELENSVINKIAYATNIVEQINQRRKLMEFNKVQLEIIAEMPSFLKSMVISYSLIKGKLTDNIYYQYSK